MTIDYNALANAPRLLIEAKLKPLQGNRFQATGFADLGPARYTLPDGTEMLLVESAQSVANRMELACWDTAKDDLIPELAGLPYIRVQKPDRTALTNSILEAHRINSPYILEGLDKSVFNGLKEGAAGMEAGPVDIRALANLIFKYDANAVVHGVFLAKSELAGGRLRLPRLLGGFIEASGVRPAESGGVKNDRVDPSGDAKQGFGNVPFHRTEFVGEIVAYFNLDLALLRGYGFDEEAERLLVALSLFKVRRFLSTGLRLRSACDLEMKGSLDVKKPDGWKIPDEGNLLAECKDLIAQCSQKVGLFNDPPVTEISWKSKEKWITVTLPTGTEKPDIDAGLADRVEWKPSKKGPPKVKFRSEAADAVKTLFGGEEAIVTIIDEALNPSGMDSADDISGDD